MVFLKLLVSVDKETPKTMLAVVMALGCPPELDDMIHMLKAPYEINETGSDQEASSLMAS